MHSFLAAHRGLIALTGREVARVLKLWTQTVVAPILSSALFILVFGLSLGDRIREIDGVAYDQFIVPGLIAMGMAQAAYALPLTGVPVREPLVLAVAVLLLLVLFCSFGVVVGVYAESWDHTAFVTNLVILPLSFLGGVFYSIDSLPSPWQELSHANPIFYLIEAVRYGFLGTSDVSVGLSLAITAAMAGVCVAWSAWLFATG